MVSNDSLVELKLWRIKIQRSERIPNTGLEALDILSTSLPERMFSTLKRVKTYLRNTMSENRLNGLAMLFVHRNVNVNPEEVLNELTLRPRRVDLLL
ncbi:52 kDa repressor of the inhibitor of the protein kinase-like [Aphis craccivora]|uniref:52 kDa repressor of the inhibitor of the protein kinase-like n=1 Tax=Aphis craccivora TaxID=307492 RepID=A0A6G0YHQ3_APHCR|nr:52 kDa repressor of the inhibitor of the protein kinase-like [Aphis craccivora]